MELKSATCPNCGGKLQLNPQIEKGICVYCGSEIIVAEAIQKFKGEIDGLATTKTHLIRAEQLLEDGDADKAAREYRAVIDLNPQCAEAYFGLFKCEVASANYYLKLNYSLQRAVSDYLNDIANARDKYGRRAIQFASGDEAAQYEAYVNKTVADAQAKAEEINWKKKPLAAKGLAKLMGKK